MIGGLSALAAGIIIVGAAVAIGGGVAVGMSVAASQAAEATKYAADRAAEAQKYTADAQKEAQMHEADLMFKTEAADRALDEKYRKQDLEAEDRMMDMFDSLDSDIDSANIETDRRNRGRISMDRIANDDYYMPQPDSIDSDMTLS